VMEKKGGDTIVRALQVKVVEGALRACYCTISVTISPCAAPAAAVAVTVIWDVPNAVGIATVTKVDPGEAAAADVAVTVIVAGFGTTAGAVYNPVPSTVPLPLPPATSQVTL